MPFLMKTKSFAQFYYDALSATVYRNGLCWGVIICLVDLRGDDSLVNVFMALTLMVVAAVRMILMLPLPIPLQKRRGLVFPHACVRE